MSTAASGDSCASPITPRDPRDKTENHGALPEWATLTSIITAFTVLSFSSSSFFVGYFSGAIGFDLASYFSPTDYLRITPVWAIPTIGFVGALAILVSAMIAVGTVLQIVIVRSGLEFINSLPQERPRSAKQIGRSLCKIVILPLFWRGPKASKLPMLAWQKIFQVFPFILRWSPALFVVSLGALLVVYAFVSDALRDPFYRCFLAATFWVFWLYVAVSFVPSSDVIRFLFLTLVWSVIFAAAAGESWKPSQVEAEPLTKVLFVSERDKAVTVEGKLIFDLDRYLLLWVDPEESTEGKSATNVGRNAPHIASSDQRTKRGVVTIPNEKVISIETPPRPTEQRPDGD
jgi:hypothetical protein